MKKIYAVCVKPSARAGLCTSERYWVLNATHKYYVSKAKRGTWETKEKAMRVIREPHEIVVEEQEE